METDNFEEKWYTLKIFLMNYRREKTGLDTDGRYCIALSIEDILEKMNEIEGKM